jgi:hypothetical protein
MEVFMKTKMLLVCFMFVVFFAGLVQAEDANGFLVTGWNGASVTKFSPNGVNLGVFRAGAANPSGVAEGGGYVYITQGPHHWIGKYNPVDGNNLSPSSMSTNCVGGGHGPQGIVYENGRVYVAAFTISYLTAFAPDNGEEDGNPATPSGYFYAETTAGPQGVTSAVPNGEPAGTVYYTTVATDGSGALGKWRVEGDAPGTFAPVELTNATFPAGANARGVVAYGGNVYVALYSLNKVVKYSIADQTVTDFVTGLNGPYGLGIAAGYLYVAQHNNGLMRAFDLGTGVEKYSFSLGDSPVYFTIRPGAFVLDPVCTSPIEGDLDGNCKVDLADFATIAANWLKCNLDPQSACE